MDLVEYRPGRYAWIDPATGAVIRKATEAEADQEIARLLAREAPQLLDLDALAGELGTGGQPTPEAEPAELPTGDGPPPELGTLPTGDGGGAWLMIDPARAGYRQGDDLRPILKRAAALFATKPTWGGAGPQVIKAHPEDAANGAGTAAAALGLAIVADPRVAKGTIWLGRVGPTGDGKGG